MRGKIGDTVYSRYGECEVVSFLGTDVGQVRVLITTGEKYHTVFMDEILFSPPKKEIKKIASTIEKDGYTPALFRKKKTTKKKKKVAK